MVVDITAALQIKKNHLGGDWWYRSVTIEIKHRRLGYFDFACRNTSPDRACAVYLLESFESSAREETGTRLMSLNERQAVSIREWWLILIIYARDTSARNCIIKIQALYFKLNLMKSEANKELTFKIIMIIIIAIKILTLTITITIQALKIY